MKKSPLTIIKIVLLACVVIGATVTAGIAGGVWSALACLAALVVAGLWIGFVRTRHMPDSVFNMHKKSMIVLMTVAGCMCVIACCLAPFTAALSERIAVRFAHADLFSYYTAQLSLTFISISVMSVLSDKSVIIYWANVSEDRLIRPTFICFAAYTYYSIGATVGSGVGVILNNPFLFMTFFAVNVGVLILLTASMIDVYYGRDTKKKKLVKCLCPYTSDRAVYESKILGLEQNLLQAAGDKNVVFLREVYELWIEYPGKFATDIGREAVSVMVSTLDAQTTGPFLRALEQQIGERQNTLSFDPATSSVLGMEAMMYDTDLWMALSSDRAMPFLEQVCVGADGNSSQNSILFLRTIVRRLTLEYNYYASLYVKHRRDTGMEIDPDLYFASDKEGGQMAWSIYQPKTADGTPLSFERYKEVLDRMKQEVLPYNEMLMVSLVRLTGRVVRQGHNWITVKYLTALPFVKYWLQEQNEGYDADALAALAALPESAD